MDSESWECGRMMNRGGSDGGVARGELEAELGAMNDEGSVLRRKRNCVFQRVKNRVG
jgi:hypothetical protein